ncbi:MAG TPA: hypothetical protein VMT66_03605 [Steroidobacteraceae bacterium]|nr:hypothetical protein [Steroidobacteraceae bacterium]
MPARFRTHPIWCALVISSLASVAAPCAPAEQVIEEIRAAALARDADPNSHPLPLAASWNMGEIATGFDPGYQIEQIKQGQYILPWFGLSVPRPPPGEWFNYPQPTDSPLYYQAAIHYLAEHHLPLSFLGTQWEVLLPQVAAAYARDGASAKPPLLSPSDPVAPWAAVGRQWAQQPTLKRLQELYPDPPLVLFVSNNEQGKQTPEQLQAAWRADADTALIARRRAIGDAWIERYRTLQRGFREGLDAPQWRAHALFVGYDAFMTPAVGRWGGWPEYSLYVPGRMEAWPYAWDGATVSYYVHDWAPDADYIVWSPEIEAMNYLPVLAEVRKRQPQFWFEISVWDGQQRGQPTDKRRFYAERKQQWSPLRYGGLTQFGMWLLRPRVVREFRNATDDRIRFGPYFSQILAAVARVHEDPTLREFWRSGRLVVNPRGGHPYQAALPSEIAAAARWFLLDSTANPARPWTLSTPLPVFALALERGERPHREWLVYAFAPLDLEHESQIAIPGGPEMKITATTAGSFSLVREGEAAPLTVGTVKGG